MASNKDLQYISDLLVGHKIHSELDKDIQRPLLHQKIVEDEEIKDVFIPPDGGYGWFVALGTFLALFWTAGMIKSYGVIFDRYANVDTIR